MNLGKENETTEFNETTSEKREACESIAAIINKHGSGSIYFEYLIMARLRDK